MYFHNLQCNCATVQVVGVVVSTVDCRNVQEEKKCCSFGQYYSDKFVGRRRVVDYNNAIKSFKNCWWPWDPLSAPSPPSAPAAGAPCPGAIVPWRLNPPSRRSCCLACLHDLQNIVWPRLCGNRPPQICLLWGLLWGAPRGLLHGGAPGRPMKENGRGRSPPPLAPLPLDQTQTLLVGREARTVKLYVSTAAPQHHFSRNMPGAGQWKVDK